MCVCVYVCDALEHSNPLTVVVVLFYNESNPDISLPCERKFKEIERKSFVFGFLSFLLKV